MRNCSFNQMPIQYYLLLERHQSLCSSGAQIWVPYVWPLSYRNLHSAGSGSDLSIRSALMRKDHSLEEEKEVRVC